MANIHICDEECETGEEATTWTQHNPDGTTTEVHGPAHMKPPFGPQPAPLELRDADGNPILTAPFPTVMYLPYKVGRAEREAIAARRENEEPDSQVHVDCFGGSLIIPRCLIADTGETSR